MGATYLDGEVVRPIQEDGHRLLGLGDEEVGRVVLEDSLLRNMQEEENSGSVSSCILIPYVCLAATTA